MDLPDFFVQNPVGAIAFSGGTDSAYLVWAASVYGKGWHAYYVHGAFQPAFELEDAKKVIEEYGLPFTILEANVLSDSVITANPQNRCYYCKHTLFSLIQSAALADGFKILIDGTNASDDAGDRPGMQALQELNVLSPLRDCGLTKADIRKGSREAGLFTWNKPPYACLATRIPFGTKITAELLQKVEQSEKILFSMGFTDFRIRVRGQIGLIQMPSSQFERAATLHEEIQAKLCPWFSEIALDLQTRQ